jgi:YVTN family beta-propeller protein
MIKSIAISISFIAVFTMQIFAQAEIPFFDKIEGSWQYLYESNGEKHQEIFGAKWILNHSFFQIDVWLVDTIQGPKKYKDKSREVLTIGNDGSLVGWLVDDNGLSHMLNLTGSITENTITLTGTNANSQCSIIYELKNTQLIRKCDGVFGGETVKTETVYDEGMSELKTHSLPAKYENIGEKGFGYICHLTEDFVTVFNPNTNEILGKIPAGDGTGWMCFSSQGNTGYIANYNAGTMTVFGRKTNETIATVGAGTNPTFLLEVNHKILISHQSADGIWVLDMKSNEIVKKFTEGTGPLYLMEKENKIYQPQIFYPYLYIIDPVKLEITKRIKTGGRPMEMAFIDNQKYGYMVNFDFQEVTKYDTKTDNVVKHIKDIKNPRGIASSPDGKLIYVTNVVDGKVNIINTDTDSLTAVIDGFTMPVSIAFTQDGKYAYVLNQSISAISVIDTKENKIIQTFYVAGNPISILIDAN